MAKLVQHMADRLKDSAEGKPLRFKETTVSNLVEFISPRQWLQVNFKSHGQLHAAEHREG
jgi:hypothetical protein